MKYVLILILSQGITTAQFDDYTACAAAGEKVREALGQDYVWYCVPQSSAATYVLDNGGD